MKPGAPSYIRREADDELYNAVLAGEYCTVLTTHQMGKSSLMALTAARLRERGTACATVDLQGKGEKSPPPEQWYYGVVKQVADGLGLSTGWIAWWKEQDRLLPVQRMTDFFADIALKQIPGAVVVFIDEVDWMIRLPFSDEFFAAIRSCFNRRATEPAFARLTFVLLGSAAPAQLIRHATRTPFNVGRGIELTDFTPEEARPLAGPLGEDGERILARILHWTNGHPYLTQKLCAKVAEQNQPGDADFVVDAVVRDKLLSTAARHDENNLKFVADRLTQGTRDLRRVLRVYRDVLRDETVKDLPASPVHTSLRLSGVVKPDAERRLQVRNRVYRHVFDEKWVREKMPSEVGWIAGISAALAIVASLPGWYWLVFPRPYVQALETASNDAQVAYAAYRALQGPVHRARADDLLAQFWERREDRDSAILVRSRAGKQSALAALVGTDYPGLTRTFRHEGPVNAVAFSPDGKLVATGASDKTARVFEVATGREVSRLSHQDYVGAVAFSADGKLVATGSWDKTARVFEAATGREMWRLVHQDRVNAVAFSPDGKLVATASWDRTARVFEAATGRETWRLLHQDRVDAVAFSPDGKLVATGSDDKTARVFDAATGREVSHLTHQFPVGAVAFSPDGKLVATGSFDQTARVFEAATGREVSRLAHLNWVNAVAFSPDGKLVATGSLDNTARVFEAATGREVSRLAHQDSVGAVAFSPDGKLVATGSSDKTARVFEAATGREMSRLAHQYLVSAVTFSPDGKLVATGSYDNTARLFRAGTGPGVSRLAHQDSVYTAAFSPDGRLIATGSNDNAGRVLEAATGREVSRVRQQNPVIAVAFSADGRLVATGSTDNSAQVFVAATGRRVSQLKHPGSVSTVAFSPDGKLVATGSNDNTARVFEVATGREVSRLPHQLSVVAVAFSPDGKMVVTASQDSTARVFEVATGREVSRLTQQDMVYAVAFSPDGKLVATGSRDGTARLFEPATGQEISRLAHQNPVSAVVFSPDGKSLVAHSGNWLHLYQHEGDHWRPIANRHLPVIWPHTLRFSSAEAHCPRCVEMVRDVAENPLQADRLNFDEYPAPLPGAPKQLVEEWSARLGLLFDSRGRIVPLESGPPR